jgi:soluble lytic murein transglycosylase-like protein
LKLALAAYNAGPERVDGDTPAVPDIPETQNYVAQILKSLEKESLSRAK